MTRLYLWMLLLFCRVFSSGSNLICSFCGVVHVIFRRQLHQPNCPTAQHECGFACCQRGFSGIFQFNYQYHHILLRTALNLLHPRNAFESMHADNLRHIIWPQPRFDSVGISVLPNHYVYYVYITGFLQVFQNKILWLFQSITQHFPDLYRHKFQYRNCTIRTQ